MLTQVYDPASKKQTGKLISAFDNILGINLVNANDEILEVNSYPLTSNGKIQNYYDSSNI